MVNCHFCVNSHFIQNQYAVSTEGAHEGGYAVAHLERFRLFQQRKNLSRRTEVRNGCYKDKIIISRVNHAGKPNWGLV